MKFESKSSRQSTFDLAPMVDIVFILVTYFLVNATLVKEPVLDIKVPKSLFAKPTVPKRIQIYLNNNNVLYLNQKRIKMSQLGDEVKAIAKNYKDRVIIKADERVTYKQLVKVMDGVKQAGIEDFSLATEFE